MAINATELKSPDKDSLDLALPENFSDDNIQLNAWPKWGLPKQRNQLIKGKGYSIFSRSFWGKAYNNGTWKRCKLALKCYFIENICWRNFKRVKTGQKWGCKGTFSGICPTWAQGYINTYKWKTKCWKKKRVCFKGRTKCWNRTYG